MKSNVFIHSLILCIISVSGVPLFQSEIIRRILKQDSDFCFRQTDTSDCDGTPEPFWDEFQVSGNFSEDLPKTLAFLFTRRNPTYPEYLHQCGGQLPTNTNFNPGHNTEIIIHGYLDGACRSAWMREMKNQLLKRGPYNVILFDWTWGNGPNYNISTANTYIAGQQLGFLIENIMNQTGVGPENFHLVGHSLGAHVAGFAGQYVKNLRRITGLDPALTPFQNLTEDERLDSSDANLVDVIHTNGGTQPGVSLGDINPIGHADFYPNGGSHQESCKGNIIKSFLSLDFLYATISIVPRICSHMQAIQYYKATINTQKCQMFGVQCESYDDFNSGNCKNCTENEANCAVMGLDFENGFFRKTSGSVKYYLNTTLQFPYCDGDDSTFGKTL